MRVEIEVGKFYDWEHDPALSDEQFDKLASARQAIEFADGRRAKRVLYDVKKADQIEGDTTVTSIDIPQSQLDDFERNADGVGLAYEQMVANHVMHVMRHHAKVEDWVKVRVPDDAELESFLTTLFITPRQRKQAAEKKAKS